MTDPHAHSPTNFRLFCVLCLFPAVVSSSSAVNYDYLECTYNSYTAACIGTNVIGLYKNRHGLTEFPIDDIKNIGYSCVKLNKNNIIRFPESTKYLASIISLDVSYNQISTLPDDLELMSELEILDISNNRVSTLSAQTRYPESLRGLLLSGNGLKTIPAGIRIPGLFVLDLSQNLLPEITTEFCVSNQLIRVDFTQNPLKHDMSHYIPTIDSCRNANEIPFCVFTDQEDISCNCYSLAPLLAKKQSFCMGTRYRGREMKCDSVHSEVKYQTETIFDINSTSIKSECSYALKSDVTNVQGGSPNTLPDVLLVLVCLILLW